MIIKPETINVEDCFHSPLANLAKQGTQEQYKDNYSVGSFIVGGAIRVISLAAYVPASILDLVLSPFIDLAIFFGAITNSESLTQANTNLTNANQRLQTANNRLTNANQSLQTANNRLTNANEDLQTANNRLTNANEDLQTANKNLKNRISDLNTKKQKLTDKNAKLNESFQRVNREKNRLDAENGELQELNKKWMGLSIKLVNKDTQSKKPLVESDLHVDENIQSKVIASAGGPSERYTPSDLVVNNGDYLEEPENKHSNSDLDEELPALEPQLRHEDRDSAYREAVEKLDTVIEDDINELIPKDLKYNGPSALDHLEAPAAPPEAPQATINAATAAKVVTVLTAVSIGAGIYTYHRNPEYIDGLIEKLGVHKIIEDSVEYASNAAADLGSGVSNAANSAYQAAGHLAEASLNSASNAAADLGSGVSNAANSAKATAKQVGEISAKIGSQFFEILGNRELVIPRENITQPTGSDASVSLNKEQVELLSESSNATVTALGGVFNYISRVASAASN